MSFIKYATVSVTLVLVLSVSAEKNDSWSILPSLVNKVYSCEHKEYDLTDCLKIKVLLLVDRVDRSDVIQLDDSIQLIRQDDGRTQYGRALSENDVQGSLNAISHQREGRSFALNRMIFDRISRFLSTHSLKFNLPKFNLTALTGDSEEGEFVASFIVEARSGDNDSNRRVLLS